MATWSLLADLSFSDLLLFAPVTRDVGEPDEVVPGIEAAGREAAGREVARLKAAGLGTAGPSALAEPGEPPERGEPVEPAALPEPPTASRRVQAPEETLAEGPRAFVVLGQIRPTTSQTLYESDLVGQVQPSEALLNMVEAYQTGVIIRAEQPSAFADGLVRITHIPVRYRGNVIGVLCRIWSPWTTRRRGTLERVYLELFERLSVMVADGLFPFVDDEAAVEEAPRVGDGVLVIDAHERITFASPNAVNALHRAAITSAIVGSSLPALGLETSAVDEAFAEQAPGYRGGRAAP